MSRSLIVFADTKYASRYMDIACYLNYHRMLCLNYFLYDQEIIDNIQERFLSGYGVLYKIDENLLEIYLLRYLLTNTLTNIYEYENSKIKKIILGKRILRYIDKIFQYVNYCN